MSDQLIACSHSPEENNKMPELNKKPKIILEKGNLCHKKITDVKDYKGRAMIQLNIATYTAKDSKKLCANAQRSKTKIFKKGDNVLTICFSEEENGERLFVCPDACENRNMLVCREFQEYSSSLEPKYSGYMEFQIIKSGAVFHKNSKKTCYMILPCEGKKDVELWVAEDLYPIRTEEETLPAEQASMMNYTDAGQMTEPMYSGMEPQQMCFNQMFFFCIPTEIDKSIMEQALQQQCAMSPIVQSPPLNSFQGMPSYPIFLPTVSPAQTECSVATF